MGTHTQSDKLSHFLPRKPSFSHFPTLGSMHTNSRVACGQQYRLCSQCVYNGFFVGGEGVQGQRLNWCVEQNQKRDHVCSTESCLCIVIIIIWWLRFVNNWYYNRQDHNNQHHNQRGNQADFFLKSQNQSKVHAKWARKKGKRPNQKPLTIMVR